MRLRRAGVRPPALLLAIGAVAAAPLLELHADNFDRVLSQYRFVLVHFWASCEPRPEKTDAHVLIRNLALARRLTLLRALVAPFCAGDDESRKFKQTHEEVARREEAITDVAHGRSDITDVRGPTSYLINWGVTRIPTIVLFRNGRARVFPHEGPSFQVPSADELAEWLASATADANAASWPRRENAELMFSDEDMEEEEVLRLAHARVIDASSAAMRADAGRQSASGGAEEDEDGSDERGADDFEQRSKSPSRRQLAAPATEDTTDRPQPQTPPANPNKQDEKENRPETPAPRASPVGRDGKPVPLPGLMPTDGADDDGGGGGGGGGGGRDEDDEQEPPPMSEEEVRAECGALLQVVGLTDASFSDVVLRDMATDVVVLFYRPSVPFCAANGTAYAQLRERYADPSGGVSVTRMDVREHRSPFAFRAGELPVLMLFPARNKRPLEFSDDFSLASLDAFVKKYARSFQELGDEVEEETEIVSGFKDEV